MAWWNFQIADFVQGEMSIKLPYLMKYILTAEMAWLTHHIKQTYHNHFNLFYNEDDNNDVKVIIPCENHTPKAISVNITASDSVEVSSV